MPQHYLILVSQGRTASRHGAILALLLFALVFGAASGVRAQGVFSPGIGPVNRAMGGAAVAAPIDGISAIHWNPATLTSIRDSVDIGFEMPISETRVVSMLPADSFGPGAPSTDLRGVSRSDAGVFPLFSNALVYSPDDVSWALGLGMYSIGGLFTNFPSTLTNPVVSPPPPNGFGTGATYSRLGLFQLAPTAAILITDHLSIGIAPTFTTADLQLSPLTLTMPDDANGDGFGRYPAGINSRLHWGFGAQAGVFLRTDIGWNFGASVKSPQWFERFTFNGMDENGAPRALVVDADLPLIASAGIAFQGLPDWLLAVDVRWTDYENASGFGDSGFNSDLSAKGVGWRSVLSVSTGAQYRWRNFLSLRLGYFYTQNPIPDGQASFNVAAPAFYQHIASTGLSVDMSDSVTFTLFYYHAFRNHIAGPIILPSGPVPGSSVELESYADSLGAGFTVRY